MAGSRRIVVEFLGQDKSLGKTARDVDGKVNTMGTRMKRAGNIAGKVLAGGFLLAGAAAVKMTKAAAEDQQAQVKLAGVLKQAAGATDAQVKSTEDWITAQGKAFGVTDDELRPALSKLVAATKDVGEAQRLASLAMDVSAGSGKSLEQVTTALQKGVNGSVGGLSRLGVATKDADGKTRSLDAITKDLARTYGGAAAKSADTAAGKQKILTTQFGELQEQIGAKLLPVMSKLTEEALKAIDWMTKHATLVKAIAAAVVVFTAAVWGINAAVRAWTAVQAAFNVVMTANPIGIVIVAIAALVAGLIYAYKHSKKFREIVNGAFHAVADAGKWLWEKVLKPVFNFIIKAWLAVAGAIVHAAAWAFGWVPGLGPKLKKAAAHFDEFKTKVNNQLDGIKDKKVKITADDSQARNKIREFRKFYKDMLGKTPSPVNVHTGPAPGTPAFAKGTRHAPGGVAWVGERGPELVDIPRGSRVHTASQSARMAGGGDFTVTAPIVLQMDSDVVWKGLLKVKRRRGGVELGIA